MPLTGRNQFPGARLLTGSTTTSGMMCPTFRRIPGWKTTGCSTPTHLLTVTPGPAEGSWEARPGPMRKNWDFYAVVPKLTQRTVEWIGEQRGKEGPFFLYVPFNSPHAPIVPTPEFRGQSNAGGYGDFMVQTDDNVGRILQALEDNGFSDNTLVVFTADNGAERYAYDRIRNHGHHSSGPLRGLKRDLYEGGHRVPFVVKWPGVMKPDTMSDALISQVDLIATIAAIVGYKLPPNTAHDSYDLLGVWKDESASPRRSIVHNTVADAYAIRHDQWVLIAAKTAHIAKFRHGSTGKTATRRMHSGRALRPQYGPRSEEKPIWRKTG